MGVLGLYSRIYDLRKERNISQKQMAEFLGVSQATYSRMERMENPFEVQYMNKVGKLFDVSIDYLVGRTDVRTPYPKGEEFEEE